MHLNSMRVVDQAVNPARPGAAYGYVDMGAGWVARLNM